MSTTISLAFILVGLVAFYFFLVREKNVVKTDAMTEEWNALIAEYEELKKTDPELAEKRKQEKVLAWKAKWGMT